LTSEKLFKRISKKERQSMKNMNNIKNKELSKQIKKKEIRRVTKNER